MVTSYKASIIFDPLAPFFRAFLLPEAMLLRALMTFPNADLMWMILCLACWSTYVCWGQVANRLSEIREISLNFHQFDIMSMNRRNVKSRLFCFHCSCFHFLGMSDACDAQM